MAALLDDLELLEAEYSELLDTEVRERLWQVVDQQLLKQETEILVPADLGMFTDQGNQRLRALLQHHLLRLREVFAILGLENPHQREASFLNPKLRSTRGQVGVDHFFGAP
jgi:hypothetical protein